MGDTTRHKQLVERFWHAGPEEQGASLADDAVWHLPRSIGWPARPL